MEPGRVTGSRAGDDARLRRRLVLAARTATAAAAAILLAGFLLAARAGEPGSSQNGVPASAGSPMPAAEVRVVPNGTAASPVVWQVKRTGDRAKDEALAAFRAYFGTAVRLAEEPDPADPALPRVAVDPELSRLRRALSVSGDAQTSRRGRVLVVARVNDLRGTVAVVIGCANWAAQRQYDGSGRSGSWRGGLEATAVRLRWTEGRWKVDLVTPVGLDHCRR